MSELSELKQHLEELEKERDEFAPDPDNYKEEYNQMLDDAYGTFKIGVVEFQASNILEEMDETAYYVGLNEYVDGLESYKDDPEYQEILDEIEDVEEQIEELEGEQ